MNSAETKGSRDSVVIVGPGMMGCGIASISALAGNRTILLGVNAERTKAGVQKALGCISELEQNDLCTKESAERAKSLLVAETSLAGALERANLVIEAIVEKLELKQDLFREIDALLPADIPIASNTSGLRITDIAARMTHPQRAVTTHFWFPGHLVPLVEVVIGDKTDESVAVAVKDRLAGWGKAPVLVKKDLPGQLANRILQAVIREAMNIVEIGLASPEDVDTAVKMGMGIRFPVWGPLEHIDAVGLDLCKSVQNTVLPGISADTKANDLFHSLVNEGNLGHKTGKGVYDWSVKDMDALAKKRNDFIIYALKKI